MEFKGTNYAFAKNINHTGGSGIIDITDNTIFCLCTEDKAKVISDLLEQRNELLEAVQTTINGMEWNSEDPDQNLTFSKADWEHLDNLRELLNKIQP